MNEEHALAIIFANTKRHKRVVDLITLAKCFEFLKNIYGNQEAIAKRTDLSREMVREFLQILNLPTYVQEIIKTRKIDGIDTAYRLSKIKDDGVLRAIVDRISNLQAHDVRDIISTVEENAGISVDSATQVVLKTKPKNLHVFIIDFTEQNYKKLVMIAKNQGCSPADLMKKIVDNWLGNVDNEANIK